MDFPAVNDKFSPFGGCPEIAEMEDVVICSLYIYIVVVTMSQNCHHLLVGKVSINQAKTRSYSVCHNSLLFLEFPLVIFGDQTMGRRRRSNNGTYLSSMPHFMMDFPARFSTAAFPG